MSTVEQLNINFLKPSLTKFEIGTGAYRTSLFAFGLDSAERRSYGTFEPSREEKTNIVDSA